MTVCEHGNVCREWMRATGSYAPLVRTCPMGCPFFEEKASDEKKRHAAKRGQRMTHGKKRGRMKVSDKLRRFADSGRYVDVPTIVHTSDGLFTEDGERAFLVTEGTIRKIADAIDAEIAEASGKAMNADDAS